MQITINGENSQLEDAEFNLLDLLKLRQVESPEMVAVQLNGEFIDRNSYASTFINPGDDIEFLYFMGGGSR